MAMARAPVGRHVLAPPEKAAKKGAAQNPLRATLPGTRPGRASTRGSGPLVKLDLRNVPARDRSTRGSASGSALRRIEAVRAGPLAALRTGADADQRDYSVTGDDEIIVGDLVRSARPNRLMTRRDIAGGLQSQRFHKV